MRKVIQITESCNQDQWNITALCDDGTMFTSSGSKWKEMDDVPQPETLDVIDPATERKIGDFPAELVSPSTAAIVKSERAMKHACMTLAVSDMCPAKLGFENDNCTRSLQALVCKKEKPKKPKETEECYECWKRTITGPMADR